ncbi:efflux RND transporter permease subunit [Peredibacter starrii]|uniref:Efflux RND transporter permease subunit n=1 Tax=Peredibacter starrii TaxID=28202 RepID=A0AAX4HJ41_9BACT|nr:efflux RND transporter permease subunit [Peredibacter starrii]WPU63245.1 efflux RND transporter permease subunit [Peredibacter starrii]
MSLSDISIRKPVFAWMLMAAMIIFGYISMRKMGVSQMPDVDFPVVNVSVIYEGAAPEVMELDVIDPIESAVLSVEGVKNVTSTARLGTANISVEFNLNKNIDVAVSEIESKINQAARLLPDDIDPPTISKVNPDDRPIMFLAVAAPEMSRKDLMAYTRDVLKDKFQTVSGVADVFLAGYIDPNLRVWAFNEKLNKLELTVNDVIGAVQAEHKESPSGFIEDPFKEKNVRTLGEATSVSEFKKLPIIRRGGSPNFMPVFLDQVVDVEEGIADVRRISRSNGKNALGLGIRKQRGTNTMAVADGVKKKMEELQKDLPPGMELYVNFDTTKFIDESIHELTFNLILSSILTAIVCWLFLGSFSATINVILAIPTSILGAFVILKYLNFTLNTFTLLALSLSIGIVVDDAIMVLENIFRHHEMGKNRVDASRDGANEISFAALAATVAIMAIFLPVAFMDGIIGKYFFQFGITISVAVGLSYIEALTLTPMRTSQFMEEVGRTSKIGAAVDKFFEKLIHFYTNILRTCLNHRVILLLGSTVFFAVSFGVVKFLPKEFVPVQDTSNFMMRVKTPDGSSLEYTDKHTREVEKYLMSRGEVLRYFVAVGGFGGSMEANSANLFVTLKEPKDRPKTKDGKTPYQPDLLNEFRAHFKEFKGAKVFVQDTSQSGFSASGRGFPVEFTLIGPNWPTLIKAARDVMGEMKESGYYVDTDTDFKESVMEIQVFPDRDKAKLRGVSVQEIGTTINALIGGVVIGKYSKDGHRNDIRIKMADASKNKLDDLKKIYVRNTRGELVKLLDVVVVKELPGVQSVNRRSRQRAITIFSGVAPGKAQGEALAKVREITQKHLPAGYTLIESGSAETYNEAFTSLIFALLMGIVIAYMVLGTQFNSFIDPITVLTALPFSFSGAFLALYLMGQSINLYSMIGLILLMGIVKKNSILLVDFTNQRREDGLSVKDALIDACPKRLRPILMTTIATIAGAIPLAFSLGAGSEALKPMAVAIIGGCIVSTVLTLVVVPAFYSLLSREKKASH